MKLVFFNDFTLGVVKGDSVVGISDAVKDISHTSPQDLISRLIESFSDYRDSIESAVASGSGVPLQQARLRSPTTESLLAWSRVTQ